MESSEVKRRTESPVPSRAGKMNELSFTDKNVMIQLQRTVICQFIKSNAPVIKSALETSRAADSWVWRCAMMQQLSA